MALGQCDLCGKTKYPQPVYDWFVNGKQMVLCDTHRKDPGVKLERTKEDEKIKEAKAAKKGLKTFYDKMLDNAPEYCESGSGQRLTLAGTPNKRTIVCHILDKAPKKFPYLAEIPENIVYLNWQAHTDFDRTKQSEAPAEPLRSICIERFKTFYKLIPNNDWHKVPAWLRESVNRN